MDSTSFIYFLICECCASFLLFTSLVSSNSVIQQGYSIKFSGISSLSEDSTDPRGGLESKLNSRLKLQSRGTDSDSYKCKKDDRIAQQNCLEYCTHFKDYSQGFCSQDQRACLCRSSGRNSIRVKFYKPNPMLKSAPTNVITARGAFACDHSLEAKSICKVFCDLRGSGKSGSSNADCALDGKSCLCFEGPLMRVNDGEKSKSSSNLRARREHDSSTRSLVRIGDLGEEKVLSPSSMGRRLPSHSLQSRPVQLSPYLPACNSYSCAGKCPPHCDSLCTRNLECFCSCPEDALYYDYQEQFQGNHYDYPMYG